MVLPCLRGRPFCPNSHSIESACPGQWGSKGPRMALSYAPQNTNTTHPKRRGPEGLEQGLGLGGGRCRSERPEGQWGQSEDSWAKGSALQTRLWNVPEDTAQRRAVLHGEDCLRPVTTQRNPAGRTLPSPATSQELPDHCAWKSVHVHRRTHTIHADTCTCTHTYHSHTTHTQTLHKCTHTCTLASQTDMHTPHTQITHSGTHTHTCTHRDTHHTSRQTHTTLT